jgi:methylphosphotriester-DNA--protein-cysteine methyltransferase
MELRVRVALFRCNGNSLHLVSMRIENYSPRDELRPFIKTFTIIESESGMVNKILPEASLIMAFRFNGSIRYTQQDETGILPLSVISGVRKSPRIMDYAKKTSILLVKFHAGGATAFFREPLHELFETSISLDDLLPRTELIYIEDQLAEARNHAARISTMERFLLSKLRPALPDSLINHAIQTIRSANGIIRIQELLSDLPISRDPFEKKFRRIVGTSPKQFAALLRMRHVIDSHAAQQSLTDTAHAAGYFDQAHFIKDFKSFTGETPNAFFKSSKFW